MTDPIVAANNPGANNAANTSGDSTIHDLGYRRYEGERVGPSGAFIALYTQGVRAMFGLGRPTKAKIVPLLAVGATFLSALGALVGASLTKGQMPVRYGQVVGGQFLLFVLLFGFVAQYIFRYLSVNWSDYYSGGAIIY